MAFCGGPDIYPIKYKVFNGENAKGLALTLLVIGILGADNHNSAVSLDDLAFVTHGFNTGSDFHNKPPKVRIFYLLR